MAQGDIYRTLYEEDGTVRRRVMKDLGGGQRVVTSDTLEHPDLKTFVKEQPDAQIRGYHPEVEREFPSPETFTVGELEDFLADIDSVDVMLRMRELDDRVTADAVYEQRIQEVLGGVTEEFEGTAEDIEDIVEEQDEEE